jgi:hypothetical protein
MPYSRWPSGTHIGQNKDFCGTLAKSALARTAFVACIRYNQQTVLFIGRDSSVAVRAAISIEQRYRVVYWLTCKTNLAAELNVEWKLGNLYACDALERTRWHLILATLLLNSH